MGKVCKKIFLFMIILFIYETSVKAENIDNAYVSSGEEKQLCNNTVSCEEQGIIKEEPIYTVDESLVDNLKMYSLSGGKASKIDVSDLSQNGIKEVRSSMPVIGDVNVLVIAVDFLDNKFEQEDIVKQLEKDFFAEENKTNKYAYPFESLQAYYKRSSFGKLNISGNILKYEAPHNREYYESNDLMEEILTVIKTASINFAEKEMDEVEAINHYLAQYDANNDYILDGLYVCYAGGTDSSGRDWLNCVNYWNGYTMGDYTFGSVCYYGDISVPVIAHETGHMLGIGDYYDYDATFNSVEGIGSLDIMQGALGDHNCFSKMLLGWIAPEKVKIIVGNIEEVSLNVCTKEGECVIVLPEYNDDVGLYTEFYLITYREFTNNDSNYYFEEKQLKGGLCIYYVNATLNSDKTGFLYQDDYGWYEGNIPLIRQIHNDIQEEHLASFHSIGTGMSSFPWPNNKLIEDASFCPCYFMEGDSFTPYTLPSSDFYGASMNSDRSYSGVFVDNICFENGKAFFVAGIEKEEQERNIVYTLESNSGKYSAIDEFGIKLFFSQDVTFPAGENDWGCYTNDKGAVIYDENGKKIGDLTVQMPKAPRAIAQVKIDDNVKSLLEVDKIYTIVIPKGSFKMGFDDVAEISFEYSTYRKYAFSKKVEITLDEREGCHSCLDENGNGIMIAHKYEMQEGAELRIYYLENYEIVKMIDSSNILLYEPEQGKHYTNLFGIWKVSDEQWGLLAEKDNTVYTMIINIDGQVVSEHEYEIKGEGTQGGKLDINQCFVLTKDDVFTYLNVFDETGYKEIILMPKYNSDVIEKTGISIVEKHNDRVLATVSEYFGNAIYKTRSCIFDSDGKEIFSSYFDGSVAEKMEYINGKTYILTRKTVDGFSGIHNFFVYVLDDNYKILDKYILKNDIKEDGFGDERSFVKYSKGFLLGGKDLYIYDDNLNFVEKLEGGMSYGLYRGCSEKVYTSAGSGEIYSIDLDNLIVPEENPNAIEDISETLSITDNNIYINDKMTEEKLKEQLKFSNCNLLGTITKYISEENVLEIMSENGCHSKYYYFVVDKTGSDIDDNHEHRYGEWETVKEATCVEVGIREQVCMNEGCEDKIVEEIPSTGNHTYSAWSVTQQPTSDKKGLKTRKCTVCDKEETEEIPATGNSEETKPDKEETGGGTTGNEESKKPGQSQTTDTQKPEQPESTEQPAVEYKEGTDFNKGNASYEVLSVDGDKGTVAYTGTTTKNKKTVSVPKTVDVDGRIYIVTEIADNAFKGNTKLAKVTISSNITKIGKNSFNGCKNLSKITINSMKLKKVGKNAFKGINKKAVIKVPKKQLAKYKKLFKGKGLPKTVKIKK